MNYGVVGIDAAWTTTQPSGVALIARRGQFFELLAIAPSYSQFIVQQSLCRGISPPPGGEVDQTALISAARMIAGCDISLVAVDMPLATNPITCRRSADNRVSEEYGRFGCGTHSPGVTRPGEISRRMSDGFRAIGYALCTTAILPMALVEVYPHPALLTLMRADYRVPYKVARARKYWPEATTLERRQKLLSVWSEILNALDEEIDRTRSMLPLPAVESSAHTLKAFEDMLDAVICAWVGARILVGKATPFGDSDSAIWIPTG